MLKQSDSCQSKTERGFAVRGPSGLLGLDSEGGGLYPATNIAQVQIWNERSDAEWVAGSGRGFEVVKVVLHLEIDDGKPEFGGYRSLEELQAARIARD